MFLRGACAALIGSVVGIPTMAPAPVVYQTKVAPYVFHQYNKHIMVLVSVTDNLSEKMAEMGEQCARFADVILADQLKDEHGET